MRKNVTIDWTLRENVRAQLRVLVKRILRKYGYPPDKQEKAHKPLTCMDRGERVRACYLHACLCYVTRKEMTNTTLRARFAVEEHNRAAVSRIIREAIEAGAIGPADPNAAPKLMRYLPFWAVGTPARRT